MNNRTIEKTIDDGNCGPAAFASGLLTEEILQQQNEQKFTQVKYRNFVNAIAAELAKLTNLNVQRSWQAVRTELLRLRRDNLEQFQEILAPIIRQFIVVQIKRDATHRHRTHTLELLHIAYENFVKATKEKEQKEAEKNDEEIVVQNDIPVNLEEIDIQEAIVANNKENVVQDDDTFVRHKSIQEKFAKFYQDNSAEEEITAWWEAKNGGHDQFVTEIAKDKAWLDDSELIFAAEFFDVGLNIVQNNNPKPYNFYIACGEIPVSELVDNTIDNEHQKGIALQTKIKELVDNEIVDRRDNMSEKPLKLLPVTIESIDKLEEMQVEDAQTFAAWRAHYTTAAVTLQHKDKHYTNVVEKTWAESVLDARVEKLLKDEPFVYVDEEQAVEEELAAGKVRYLKNPELSVEPEGSDLIITLDTHFLVDRQKQVDLDEKLARALQSAEGQSADVIEAQIESNKEQIKSDEEFARALAMQFEEEDRKGPKLS